MLKAFGYEKCADQSVIQETLNAVTDENIQQMESALNEIWKHNNLSSYLIEKAQKENKTVTIDIDLSGQIASKNAEQSQKGYFSNEKNAYGRQLVRVLVCDTQEIVTESLYSGNTVSWDNGVFKSMIANGTKALPRYKSPTKLDSFEAVVLALTKTSIMHYGVVTICLSKCVAVKEQGNCQSQLFSG